MLKTKRKAEGVVIPSGRLEGKLARFPCTVSTSHGPLPWQCSAVLYCFALVLLLHRTAPVPHLQLREAGRQLVREGADDAPQVLPPPVIVLEEVARVHRQHTPALPHLQTVPATGRPAVPPLHCICASPCTAIRAAPCTASRTAADAGLQVH